MLKRATPFLAGLLGGLLAAGLLMLFISEPRGHPVELLPPPTPQPLRVHVSGAVQSPGVYLLEPGAIVEQALRAAGGPEQDAVLDAVNLAAELTDGQKVYIPRITESPPPPPVISASTGTEGTCIDVNNASADELESLPGIGPSLAEKILEERQSHGPFVTADDLLQVSGIGPAKLEGMRDQICLP